MKALISFCAAVAICFSGAASDRVVQLGDKVENLHFKDIRFLPRSLDDLGSGKTLVLVFTTVDCPLVQRYLPRLNELQSEFGPRGVQFLAINEGVDDSIRKVAYQAIEHGCSFPFLKDIDNRSAKAVGATRTPQAVILDSERRIRYRGRIDNQYRLGGVKPKADQPDLRLAIDAVLKGEPVKNPETPVDGCAITFPAARQPRTDLTYARDVAPILNKHCVECHRQGTEAPFVLTSFEKASAKAKMIAEVVDDERMPPWYAHPDFGSFKNARLMSSEEKAILIDWAKGSRAAGDLSQAPAPPHFPETKWLIGEPDLVLTTTEQKIPPTGYIDYRYAILPYVFLQDTWVQAIQIQPGNTRVVHHANLAYVTIGKGFDEKNGFLTGRVPGGIPVRLDPGMAMLIPNGATLGLQIHYVTTGKDETDRISVGFKFAGGPVIKRVRYKLLADYGFAIPPNDPAHLVSATRELECNAIGLGLFQHMHLRGKDTTFIAHYPDGKDQVVLAIPNYSFDWQLGYVWQDNSMRFPKGTRLECRSHFDNSPFNPYNPDPKATVRNGPQTHHEMMQGYFFYIDADEQLNVTIDPKTGHEVKSAASK